MLLIRDHAHRWQRRTLEPFNDEAFTDDSEDEDLSSETILRGPAEGFWRLEVFL